MTKYIALLTAALVSLIALGSFVLSYNALQTLSAANGMECYFVSLYSNGEVNRCYTVAMTDESNHFHSNGFSTYIFAKSKDHAIKIASDKRAQLLYESTEES